MKLNFIQNCPLSLAFKLYFANLANLVVFPLKWNGYHSLSWLFLNICIFKFGRKSVRVENNHKNWSKLLITQTSCHLKCSLAQRNYLSIYLGNKLIYQDHNDTSWEIPKNHLWWFSRSKHIVPFIVRFYWFTYYTNTNSYIVRSRYNTREEFTFVSKEDI